MTHKALFWTSNQVVEVNVHTFIYSTNVAQRILRDSLAYCTVTRGNP